jgi:uncharacterized coiled-coil protein SlyX
MKFMKKTLQSQATPMSQRALELLFLLVVAVAAPPVVKAVIPAPDGSYPGNNTAEGEDALLNLPNTGYGSENTALGFNALLGNETGNFNTATGASALYSNISGDNNTATGRDALFSNNNGSENTAIGKYALVSNTSGSFNTANGSEALRSNTTAYYNTANGCQALFSNRDGGVNVANGYSALQANVGGFYNVGLGGFALGTNTGGSYNVATGANALYYNKGSNNTADGHQSLQNNTSGDNNVAVGYQAGANLTTGSNNIVIGAGVVGVAGETNTIRIGRPTQAKTLIAGIYGKTVASASSVAVRIDSTGKLGTVLSSARYKEGIKAMDKSSEAILALEPVIFRYKKEFDPDGATQFGLIAEQVAKVSPDLVVRDEDGEVMTVRYEAVNAMLLNEFLKEHTKVQEQQSTIAELKSAVADQQTANARQQKQIEALTATMQKVSDQVELSKPAARLIANNH